MRGVYRWYRGKRIWCDSGAALHITEEFIDRYTNVAIGGLNYSFFGRNPRQGHKVPPFRLNCHVYSCMLILNELPHEWRGRYNEDTDLCLQVLADGWCTIQMQIFLIDKLQTMTMKGGNTDQLYDGDGRLYMARSLERKWPGVVKTTRKFKRPQHHIKANWQHFDNKLIKRNDVDFDNLKLIDEYGLNLQQVKPEIVSKRIQGYMDEQIAKTGQTVKPAHLVNTPPSRFVNVFLNKYASMYPINRDFAKDMIDQILRHRGTSKEQPIPLPQYMVELEGRWYDSLNSGEPDYAIYDDDYYFTDMWVCWAIYSRNYLRTLLKPNVYPIVENVKTIADLGCGIGYTTAGFKQIFPSSEVIGTNLEGTKQHDFCKVMADASGFKMASDIQGLGQIDLVFASEYFEHILAPITHLEEILATLSPRFLYVANSFNTHSIGHFNHYSVERNWLPASKLSGIFNKTLFAHGYRQVEIKAWNNKPALWAKDAQNLEALGGSDG